MAAKGPEAFRTISEAAEEVGVPSHVLRFWETKFSFIRPMKRAGGRRFYRPQDLTVLRSVRTLLHDEHYTIKGVQKLHKEQGLARLAEAADRPATYAASAVLADRPASAGETDDQADLFAGASEQETGRFVLDLAARERLGHVLRDLEAVKARIDGLLDRSQG